MYTLTSYFEDPKADYPVKDGPFKNVGISKVRRDDDREWYKNRPVFPTYGEALDEIKRRVARGPVLGCEMREEDMDQFRAELGLPDQRTVLKNALYYRTIVSHP